jgi:predicted nucleotidyltransferase
MRHIADEEVAGWPKSVREVFRDLALFPQVHAIVLFGSRAVGDNDDKSDFDVAISAPEIDTLMFARIRDRVAHARTLHRVMVSRLDTMPHSLRSRVMAQGVLVYER